MIVILAEEESMKKTLEVLVERYFPHLTNGLSWFSFGFQGSPDLEKNIRKKMENWHYGDPFFIILRDQDGAECLAVKEKLHDLAKAGGKPFRIRIVCMELESWLLGELEAVETAYPSSKANSFRQTKKFRNPDLLVNASQELEKLVGVRGKVERAGAIAQHFQPERCTSNSFEFFWRTMEEQINLKE